MLIALTGADGVGKSTVSALLKNNLGKGGENLKTVDRWDIMKNNDYPACRFIQPDLTDLKQCIAEMQGPSRFMFILWSIYSVMESYERDTSSITFIDSYWMKHAAAEISYGLSEKYVRELISLLPTPDLTILLKLPAEEAYRRKTIGKEVDLNYYECGMDKNLSRERFINHQNSINSILSRWSNEYRWFEINTDKPVMIVEEEISVLSRKTASKLVKNIIL